MSTQGDKKLLDFYAKTFGEDQPGTKAPHIIAPDELLPPARALYEANLRKLGVDSLPIILDPNKGTGDYGIKVDFTKDMAETPPVGMASNYISVSEYWHKWSAEDARQNEQITGAELDATRQRVTNPAVLKANEAAAAKLGVSPPPTVYYAANDEAGPHTYSAETREGQRYIVLDPNDMLGDQIASIPHEMGHHALGHVTAEGLAKIHNANLKEAEISRRHERAADKEAIIACGGNALADSIANWQQRDLAIAESRAAFFTSIDGKPHNAAGYVAKDDTHPADEERIAALRKGAKEQADKGACPVDPAMLTGTLAGLKQATGGHDVAQNDAPNANGTKPITPQQR